MTAWANRADFAEVAEAIGVPTDHVIGMQSAILITYSASADDPNADVTMAVLARNPADGILCKMRSWRLTTLGEFQAELEQSIEELLDDES